MSPKSIISRFKGLRGSKHSGKQNVDLNNTNSSHLYKTPSESTAKSSTSDVHHPTQNPRDVVGSAVQQISIPTSQRLWNKAYDSLENGSDTADFVQAYNNTLTKVLTTGTSPQISNAGIETSTMPKDHTKRQKYMRKLLEEGQVKVNKATMLKKGVGDIAQFFLSVKAMVDLAVQNVPQAALPWAGVCIGLEMLANPAKAIESNLAGIIYVISRMDWYCSLTEHILKQDSIVIGEESLQFVQQQLETRTVALYKAFLLYQMKSICSFYQHQGLVFLRSLVNLDDWDTDLQSIKDAETALQKDLDQFTNQYTKSLLGQIIEEAKRREALLGGIHQVLQDSLAFQKEIHKDERDNECLRNLRLTDPRDDKKRIEKTKGGLLKDAYCWILNNIEFQQWRDDENNPLLWIKGDPGKGKTMLLCGIIDELEPIASSGLNSLLSYFFCQATDSQINNSTAVLRGLIFMLIDKQPSLMSHLRKKYDQTGKKLFEDTNAWVALSEIFSNILGDPSLKRTYLIIDALDECRENLRLLLSLIIQTTSPRIKWIVSSRNWPNIQEDLETTSQKITLSLELNEKSIADAIDIYIRHKVNQLASYKKYNDETRNAVQQYLLSNANGTFLWVALVCQNLEETTKWKTITRLSSFPPGLDALYKQMIKYICDSEDVDLCKHILAVMLIVYRPLTLNELVSYIDIPRSISNDFEVLGQIIGLCGSFLTIRDNTIYFIHQSAKDYLSESETALILPNGYVQLHSEMVSRSVSAMSQSLRRDIYNLKNPGISIKEAYFATPDPLLSVRYACTYWMDHLCEIDSDSVYQLLLNDNGSIDNFLRTHFLHWLEALSLMGSLSQGVIMIRKLKDSLNSSTSDTQITTFIRDAYRFILTFRDIIENVPLQVYCSALVFSPNSSLIRNIFQNDWPNWIKISPRLAEIWSPCLQTLEGHTSSVTSIAFSHDSKLLASASADKTVRVWDAATGALQQTLEGHTNWVASVVFSHDSKLLASASGDKTVRVWDAATGALQQTLEGHIDDINSVAFSHNSKLLASASADKTVRVWDAATGALQQTLEGHTDLVASVVFSHDSKLLASASGDKTVRIWDAATGALQQTLEGHTNWVASVVFSHDSKLLASASGDKTIRVWDAATGVLQQMLEGHTSWITSVVFSHDSKLLASASGDKTVRVWNAATNALQQTLEGHTSSVRSVAFSHDSKLLASASHDKTVRVWDAATGALQQTLEGYTSSVTSVVFSHDSKLLASASYDKTIRVWNAATGALQQTLEGHTSSVTSVVFSHDSKLLASASHDKTVRVWNAATGALQQTFEGYANLVTFSSDSSNIITDFGTFNISHSALQLNQTSKSVNYTIASNGKWITWNGNNILWIPPEYRSKISVSKRNCIGIGCSSGIVYILNFHPDILPFVY